MKFPALPQSSCAAVFRRAAHFQIAVVSMLLPGLTIWTSPVMANPNGGTVVHGDVSFGPGTGGNLQIRQNSRNAIIDWESFSIEAGELTQFRQPNSNAAVLNRVTGGDPSAIHGALRANGNVFVINPNGILVGPGGTIDVHGLVLSTLDVSNGEFLAGGDMTFAGVGEGVTNLGRINAIGGDVFLIGRTVTNSGAISASGTVGLAAGEEVLLTAGESATGERMFVRAKGSGVSGTGIFNDGTIEGAAVELKAHGNIYALAINNKGSIRATGATTSGGRVFLRGAGGTVENSGSIRATSSGSGNGGRVLIEAAYAKVDGMIRAQGGQVRITGTDKVEMSADLDATHSGGLGGDVVVEGGEIVLGNGASIDASGATGGGNVRVGGGFQGRDTTVRNADTLTVESGAVVRADALVNGAGGNVILWADNDTLFNGEVTAQGFNRGGFAEISGKRNLGFDGLVDLTAENGPAGSLLLDPTNVTIGTAAASATNINNIALSNSLDLGTNVIIATNYGGAGPRGDITIVAGEATTVGQNMGGIEWYQQSAATVGGTLSLLATGNILFANDVRSAGAGGINIVAGWNGTTGLLAPIDPLNGTQAQTSGGFDMAAVLATLNDGNALNDAAGLNSGSVFINGYDINGAALNTVSEGIEVGSRFGATRVAAHDLLIRGVPTGQGWAQLGFRDSGNEFGLNGTIAIGTQNGERNEWWGSNGAANGTGGATQFGNIQNKDYIALLGGTVESGPGGLGAFKGAGYGATGAIEVGLSGRLDVRGGDSGNAYAQIGHGGTGAEGVEIARNAQGIGQVSVTTRDGAVIDVADNNRTYFGTSWRTNYMGASARVNADITIKAAEDILIMAPSTFETNVGYTDLTNNEGNGNRYVMVGHGGMDNFGSYHGNISVIALGATTALDGRGLAGSGIQLRAGMGSLNPAQIGHGGFHEGNRRTIFDQTSSGNVTVRAETGAVRVLGYNLLPRTGDSVSGPYANLSTILPANSGNDTEFEFSNVQIGHGGWHRDRVATGGTFTAPVGFTATAVLPDQSMSGNIEVYAGGTVQVRDNMGYDEFGNWTADPGPGVDPQLTAGGILREVGIEVRAGNNGNAYGLIGHGGFNMNSNTTGTIQGNIGVTAAKGTVLFVGGEEKRSQRDWGYGGNYVQIGHGGYDSDAMNATSGFAGSISVLAGQGGINGLGQAITPLDGDLIFRTGRAGESWAQIGHGGRSSNGDLVVGGVSDGVAPITVIARDGIEFTGRKSMPTLATALVTDYNVLNVANPSGIGGDGNAFVGQGTGNIVDEDTRPQVTGRGLTYNIDIKHAQIGHGGFDFLVDNQPTRNFSLNNDINVNAQTGGLRFTASNANNDYIMIGMGGLDGGNQRNITGADIVVNAADEIIFDASDPGVLEWNRVPVSGSLGYEARQHSRGARGFAMIGNGGYDVDGDFTGTITVTTGGQLQMLSSGVGTVNTVTGYIGNTVSGPAATTGTTITTVFGTSHSFTALQEATMKARSFTLYHGANGASTSAFKGAIVPNTVRIDTDDPDLGDYNSDGLLRKVAGGPIFGTVDYATGVVTIYERHLGDDNAINRNVDYSYTLPSSVVQNIQDERTPESDSAIRANQAYLGHGGILPGTISLVIDGDNNGGGRKVITDHFQNGILYNEQNLRVGLVDYVTGRVIIEGVNTATGDSAADGEWDLGTLQELRAPLNSRSNPDEVVANYQYSTGSRDQSFVQIGNGGYSANFGGRNTPGHSGEIVINAGGDVRLHGGAHDDASVQIGHGGRGSQGIHGYRTDQVDRANPNFSVFDVDRSGNITVTAGGILEVLAGKGFTLSDNEQYAQIGHGGLDGDGHHQGNIRLTTGSGVVSTSNGQVGGSGRNAGLVVTAGQVSDAYGQVGHGGFGTVSSREDGDTGQRGFTGNITVNSVGDVLFTSGTSLRTFSTEPGNDYQNARLYTLLGHGGYDAHARHDGGTQLIGQGIGHEGDISVISSAGSIVFQAGDHNKPAPGGAILGEGYGILHSSQLGHGGYNSRGDHAGNITVDADGDIQFYGGAFTFDDSADKRNYALLGNGGDEADGFHGRRDVSGAPLDTISVTAGGNIDFIGGSGRRNWVQLGNGGLNDNGDQMANLNVTAGGDINFLGGMGATNMSIAGDSGYTLDLASFHSAGSGNNAPAGWAQLRWRDIRTAAINFTITVNGITYIANGSTVQEADADGAFTTARIVESTNTTNVVGEIDLRTGSVRFFQDIDPTNTNTFTSTFNVQNGGTPGGTAVSTETQITNPMLARAIQGPGFAASSPQLMAGFNNTRGGIVNVVEDIATNDENIGIRSGSFRINVPDGTVVTDNGAGRLVVSTVGAGSNLTAGQDVGDINYTTGQIALGTIINPSARLGVTASYTLDRTVGSDLSYAQLGNGGYDADSGNSFTVGNRGNINVNGSGDIRFHGGNGSVAYTQLGHGGAFNQGQHSGNITLNSQGIVEFLAGNGADLTDGQTYAQLGHGGYDGDGTHNGTITVNAKSGLVSVAPGNLTPGAVTAGLNFRGGRTDQAYVQLGHGGYGARSGNATGLAGAAGIASNISVIADGSIQFTAGTLREDIFTNNDGQNYAMLGHGGHEADVTSDGVAVTPGSGIGHKGSILVQSRLGSVKFYGGSLANGSEGTGNGRLNFAQLGHGGFATNGEHSGDITVLAGMEANGTVNNPNADIEFKGGGTNDNDIGKINYAQLGHGGRDSIGNMGLVAETILVKSSRDLTFAAGNDQESYAQLGNGGHTARGNHSATIDVFAGRNIAFTGNLGALGANNERTTDFHQATNLGATTLGTGQGDAIVDLEGSALVPGTLVISIPGGPTLVDNGAGQIIIQNAISVDVNGDTIPESFTAGQVVGTINYNQDLGGGNRSARVTFTADVNPDNRPSTVAPSTPLVSASATYQHRENSTSYAQLGHGGYDADDFNTASSTITMPDGNLYTFGGYRVGGPNAAERVGNQGNITVTSANGNLSFLGGENGNSYVQLGHGGMFNDSDQIGTITIRVDQDGSAGVAGGKVTFDARGGNFAGTHYAQLGHGGYFASGGHVGAIDLGVGGDITFFGGRDSSYASIGHGGRNDHRLNYATVDGPAAGNSTDNDTDGNYATAGVNGDTPPDDRRDNANDRYYAGTHSGAITVRSLGSISFTGYGDSSGNIGGVGYVQIGHGGFRNAADPNSVNGEGHTGNIVVEAGGLTFNGGGQITAAQNASAAITFVSGAQQFSSAQIGHGGYEAFGNHTGNIRVASAAGVDFHAQGGFTNDDNRNGRYSYLQIGHGGINSDYDPNLPRALESTSNTVGQVFEENALNNVYYANAVSGGTHLPGTVTGVDLDRNLLDDPRGQGSLMPLTTFNQTYVNPTTVRFVDHDNNAATVMRPLTPTNRGQWFHINTPGAPASGNTGSTGDINVVSLSGALNFAAQPGTAPRGREAYVQVGHGGLYTGGDHEGNVSAIAQDGSVNLLAGLATINDGALNSYAQIGHGGSWSGGDMTGNLTVKALGAGNRVNLRAGLDNQNYAQIGHGGYDANFLFGAGTQGSGPDANGVTTQDIRALSGTELRGQNLLYWYNPQYIVRDDLRSAVVGDVGNGISDPLKFSFYSGNINVVSATGVEIAGSTAGTAASNFAPGAYGQIGHGGRSTQSHSSGNILVDASGLDPLNGNASIGAGGAITATGGNSDQNYVQIGHGGYDGDGNHGTRDVDSDTVLDGNITVRAGSNGNEGIFFRGGSRLDSTAQIGHGGLGARSANWLDLTGPTGTGGPDTFGDSAGNRGNILIDATGSIVFVSGTSSVLTDGSGEWSNYVQLGHGGYDADVHTQVGAGALAADPTMNGTTIGHNGNISATSSGGRIIFYAGDPNRPEYASAGAGGGRFQYALLGHGGFAARGSHFGNINVSAASDILFSGGAGDARNAPEGISFAQLGHGGRSANGDMGSRDVSGNATETIRVRSGRDILFEAGVGQENYAQLGNGGRDARGDHAANIQVLAERNMTFRGSLSDHLAAIPGRTNGNTYQRTNADAQGLNDATNNLAGVSEAISLWNQKIVPGTINFTVLAGATALGTSFTDVRDNPTATTGTIVAADTTVVGTVNYVTGVVTMTQPIHTGTDTANNVRVTYRHTDSGLAFAQLGNGGSDSDNGGAATVGNVGNITVGARTGHIMFQAGNDNQTYAQIGHGGYETEGSNRGNIFVRAAGDISLIGGTGNSVNSSKFMYTQIGHGGFGADTSMAVGHSGNIMVSSGTGALFSSLGTGIFNDVFDLDGNGSLDSVTFGADVSVNGLRLLGGSGIEVAGVEVVGDESSAQIGHGGRSAGGNHTGNIGVSATNDISLLGGTAYRSFTQVGHGGLGSTGNLSGAISVISENGDLTLRAGAPVAAVNTFEAYALIGHGDDRNNNQTENAGGTRQGRIFVLADRITLDRSDNELAWIGHTFPTTANVVDPFAAQTLTTPANNLGGGYEVIGRSGLANMNNGVLVTGGTISINDSFRDRYITPNLKDGNFAFSGGNLTIDTIIDNTTSYALPATHTRSVSFLAAGDIDVNRRISSPGSGAINLIAGARLATSSIVDDPSRTGGVSGTNLNFPDIDHLWIPPTGYINMSLVRNDPLQWGFDNGFSLATGAEFDNAAGEISIDAANNGGNFNLGVGSKTGETNALGYGVRVVGGDSASEYAQLGFNTDAAADPATGSVWVSAKNDGVLVQSGSTTGTSAQVGHGGVGGNTNVKDLSGSITVRADYGSTAGNVSVLSGTGDTNQAQIGHGGRQNDGNHSGDITVIGQGITVTSAASVAQIGHGGFQGTGNYSGNIYVNYDRVAAAAAGGGGALAITAGAGFDDYAQIGHGGVVATNGNRTGDIIVGQSSSVSLQGGTNKSTSAQIGHGGVGAGTGTLSGNIEVNTTGNLSVRAGASATGQGSAFAQIGHGGTGSSGAKNGNITVNAQGTQITLAGANTAVVSNTNFAQIGHGGDGSGGNVTGNLAINAPNAGLDIVAGNQTRAFAKVGHGGYSSGGVQTGTIDIDLGGAVNLNGGADHAFAQIGHGGSLAAGNRDGAISVMTSNGNLSMLSGTGLNSYTQIGHGGVGATGNHGSSLANGEIHMGIAGNILMNAGGGTDAYTQIGQGGSGAAGTHLGEICVNADGTITINNGSQGLGTRAYGQIGHGGFGAAGNHSGDVTVVSGYVDPGGITMNGGRGTDQYVQIGHGGTNAGGNLSGRVYVVADKGGDLVMNGGIGNGAYAMISHGDGHGTYGSFGTGTTGGTRQGGIQYFVDGDAILNAGTGSNSNVHLIHRTNDSGGLNTTNYLGGDGYQYVVNGTSIGNAASTARENESTIIAGNFGTGNIVITNTGNLTLNNPLVPTGEFVNHSFSFIVLSTGNLNFERSFQNAGTGLVALVAGWDGVQDLSTINYNNGPCDPEIIPGSIDFNDCDRFGNNNGVLTVGSATQTGPFAVGSRQGQTILRGYGINVVGSNTTAGGSTQVGFRADGSGDITGTINVRAKQGGLTLQSGTADNAFVQIGHGTGSGSFANNVTTAATVSISFCEPGAVTLNGGGNGAFAMIGNGGGTGNYTRNGNVTITDFAGVTLNSGTGTGAFTQIGSGGLGGQGAINSVVTLNGQGNIGINGGSGGNAFAHIGAGGLNHAGAITGATSLQTTGGNLTMSGGAGSGSFAQLGAGGLNADGIISGAVSATIDGSILLTGGSNVDSYVQIGVGGSGSDGVKSGDVTVSGTSATLTGGTGAGSSVLVGNGGGSTQAADNASGSITGNTSVTATAGAVSMSAAGAAADNFAQIGAGGRGSVGSGNTINSTTSVTTTGGGLTMNAANAAYVQIGVGGHQVDVTSLTGDVLVNAGGAIALSGGSGQNRYAQIGNGGMGSDATKSGNTTVTGTSLLMTTGAGAGSNVMIGLGGGMDQTNSDFSNGALTGNVLVTTTTDGVTMNSASAGVQAFAQIGNGGLVSDGNLSGTTTVNSAGAVSLTAGAQSNTYARIGAGGSGNDGTISNAATTVTGTNLSMTSGSNASAYTQIGAGGGATGGGNLALGNITGDVSVTMTGTIAMNAGSGGSAFSQIGAGGAGFNGTSPLNTITSATNVSGTSLAMNSGGGSGAYAQIGAGGGTTGVGTATPVQGSITGNVTVGTTAGGITMGATSSGTRSYIQIGAGGSGIESGAAALGAANTISSNTSVTTVGGDLTMNSSLSSYHQIGAGGLNSDGTINGAVNVTVGGALNMTGGVGTRRYSQIGNGGSQSDGAKSGAINVSANSIGLTAGSTERAYAQIGHGGADASGVVTSANLAVNSIGAINLASGGNQAYTQIGHGGFNALNLTVPNSTITINNNVGTGTGDITLSGGTGTNATAIIGHGGARTDANLNFGDVSATGDVSILRAANVRVNGGSNTDAFAQIGHAGERATATFSGNIAVTTAGLVQVQGGATGTGAYGQIGHGGRIHTGAKSGSITVSAVGPLSLLGGGASGNSAQIGHGGNSSSGNLTGDIALNIGGNVSLLGGSQNETYAQVGHGGHLATGTFGGNVGLNYNFGTNVVTGAAGSFTMTGGSGAANDAYAQFGHGGSSNNTGPIVKSGNVVVGGVTSATLSGGASSGGDNYVQIGHGGDENDGNATGSVALLSSGLVTLNGGSAGSDGYVQIGLGGHEATGNFGTVGDSVTVIGLGIDLNGGNGLRSSVQIGSGGYNADGALIGNVFVNVNPLTSLPVGGGAITVNAGGGTESFVQIGLGGSAQDGDKNGNTTIQGTSLEVVAGGGAAAHAQIGSGSGIRSDLTDFGSGLINTTTSVTTTAGGVTVSAAGAGAHSFAQIGGGGLIADGALSGNTGVSTIVNATGDIVLTGGGNSNNYAMIGLGGSGGDGVKSFAGTSVTGASVTMTAGSGASAFTQIGSGGGMTGGANVSVGAVTGDTTLTTNVGGITVNAGTGANAYSLIGTGGSNLSGDITATVIVNSAAGLALSSANGAAGSFTQVGLGGLNADGVHTGTTTVSAAGAISLTGGATEDTYSQIGSGGAGSDGNKVNAAVSVRGASVVMTSGAGLGAYTQIGSGGGATGAGVLPTGNSTGAVNVVTTVGGISLAGGGDRAYSQIGQGGGGRTGAFTGEIQIVSADGLGITGGTAARGYALVGHGGAADAGGFTTGLREGNVLISAEGLTQLTDGTSTAFIGHRGATGVTGASRLALITGQLDTTANVTGVTGMIANVIGVGTAEIGVTNGNLVVNGAALNYNSANEIDLFASGNTTVLGSLQNAGAGALNLVAGWDATTGLTETINPAIFPPISALALDYSAVAADTAAYTNNAGVVSIGNGTQTTPIAVGSALGQTNLLGDGVALVSGSAPGTFAQVGFRGTSNALINGTINVGVGAGGLNLQSSSQSGAFTQIGHGGAGAVAAAVQADINLDFVNGGDLTATAGNGNAAYAQIGHGGSNYAGSVIGDITASGTIGTLALAGGGAASQAAYAQIGHGGDAATGSKNGDISLEAEEVSVDAGTGFRSGAQIGHGGRGGVGNLAGSIDVTTTVGDLSMAALGGNFASAQIGHGGLGYSGLVTDQPITVDVAGSLLMQGGSGNQSSAQIGHGGASSSGANYSGDVVVTVGEDLGITGGTGLTAFAQIGHGGALVTSILAGDITVSTGGDAGLSAPNSATSGAYAKIGHGDDMRGSFGPAAGSGSRAGDIEVAAGGSLTMNQALVGHTNSTSNATSVGTTHIGVSWLAPGNPLGGNLVADAASEFSGDELRFYVPRRANNQVAAGVMMNGVAYAGGLSDPYPTKRADEYTNYIQTKSGTTQLAEHDSTFGSGPAPTTAGSYAFYFDTIVQGTPVQPPLPPEPPTPPVPPAPDYRDSILDDRVIDDWLREQEGLFSTPGSTSIFYEGYTQYGPNGESIYNFNNAAGMGSDEEEDVLRRQLELLEEQAEQAEQAGQSGGAGDNSQGAE